MGLSSKTTHNYFFFYGYFVPTAIFPSVDFPVCRFFGFDEKAQTTTFKPNHDLTEPQLTLIV